MKNRSWLFRQMSWLYRRLKYRLAAPVLSWVVRKTSWLDGDGVPPRIINFAADGDFVLQGDWILGRLRQDFDLSNGLRILDIGSGIGRVATAFHRDKCDIRYDGFDIVKYGVEWCEKMISPDDGYRFIHSDVSNPFYNPKGTEPATTYQFPYTDNSFDLAIAVSVFTHLLEAETRAYFAQSLRVLDVGGQTYFTTFLVPDTVPDSARFSFAHRIGAAFVERREEPEMAVGYTRQFWEELGAVHNAKLIKVNPGSWTGLQVVADFQDVLIFEKMV